MHHFLALHLWIQPLPTHLAFVIVKTLYVAASTMNTYHLHSVQHDSLSSSNIYVLVSFTADAAVHNAVSIQPVVKSMLNVQSTSSQLLA